MSGQTAGSKVKEAMKEKMDAVLQKVKAGTKILKELREFDALIKVSHPGWCSWRCALKP